MRILYVSHTGIASGAERSLLVLMRAIGLQDEIELACPEGELAQHARAAGVHVHVIGATNLSARLHPWHTPHELARAAWSARRVAALARRRRVDVVHANTPRAAMLAWPARGMPLIMHVRDAPPPGRLPASLLRGLADRAAVSIATSRYLADQLPAARIRVVPNALEAGGFTPRAPDRVEARRRLGITPEQAALAVVGQISPHKAQSDAIRTLQHIRAAGVDAKLVIAGSVKFTSSATRFDNRAYERECHALATSLGLASAVRWLGECPHVAEVLTAADLALVPSWYEPFGRVALEAMAMKVPVLGTSVGGVCEVVRDGRDGRILPPRRPELWAQAALELLADPGRRAKMGSAARRRALERFGVAAHARAIRAIYRETVDGNWHEQPSRSVSLTASRDRAYLGTGASRG